MSWIDAMALDGLGVWITPARCVGIADATSGWRWGPAPLLRRARYLRVGDVDTLPADARRSLLVARRISRPARAALPSASIAWALDDGRYHVADRRGVQPLVTDLPEPGKSDLLAAVALLLSETPDMTQRRLAAELGVSQPRIHALLRRIAAAGVDRRSRQDLITVWRDAHHDPPTEAQHWVSDASAWDQVAHAYDVLESAGHTPVVGGEVAADQLTAWATPETAVIHAKGLRPLGASFVPAASPDEATLTVNATTDPLVHALVVERDGSRIARPLPSGHNAVIDLMVPSRTSRVRHNVPVGSFIVDAFPGLRTALVREPEMVEVHVTYLDGASRVPAVVAVPDLVGAVVVKALSAVRTSMAQLAARNSSQRRARNATPGRSAIRLGTTARVAP